MFVANITTAITKASEKIFDIRDNEGTLKGGSLKLKKFTVLWLLFSRFFFFNKKYMIRKFVMDEERFSNKLGTTLSLIYSEV